MEGIYERNQQPPLIDNSINTPAATTGTFQKKDIDGNFPNELNLTPTRASHELSHSQMPLTSDIQDTHHLFQPQQHQENQPSILTNPAQSMEEASNMHRSQQQTNPSANSAPDFDPPTNTRSTKTVQGKDCVDPVLIELKKKWDAEMGIDNFIVSKAPNLPQPCQDFLNKIVQDCHQMIFNHLTPDWSTTFTRCTQIIAQGRGNANDFESDYGEEVKKRQLEREALMSCLQVYIMQKICFDKAILSWFNKIVNEYEAGCHEDISLDDNKKIKDIADKINLEKKRLRVGLPIYANRHQIQQQVNSNQVVIINGHTGMFHKLIFLLSCCISHQLVALTYKFCSHN